MNLLIRILIGVLVLALVFWLIMFIPLPPPFGLIVRVIVVVIGIVWLLRKGGMLPKGTA